MPQMNCSPVAIAALDLRCDLMVNNYLVAFWGAWGKFTVPEVDTKCAADGTLTRFKGRSTKCPKLKQTGVES